MSQARRPVYVGVEEILDGFESLSKSGAQVFAVWYSDRDPAFQCTLDYNEQREILEANLRALERSGNTDVLYLKMYPQTVADFIQANTKPISVTPIQVCEFKGIGKGVNIEDAVARPTGMSYEAWEMLKQLKDMPTTIEAKINAAVEAKISELFPEEPEEDPTTKVMGYINGISQNPQLMAIIGQVLGFLKPSAGTQARQIGMVEPEVMGAAQAAAQRIPFDENLMNDSLEILSYHCDLGASLAKLASIAQNNPQTFKMLLGMLNNA